MVKYLPLIVYMFCCTGAIGQVIPYKIYDKQGNEVPFENIANAALGYEVVLFGELHNNSLVHWLQLQLLKELSHHSQDLVLGGEFFESDDQLNIDEWFGGKIIEKNFEAEAKLWNNYIPDYRPLMRYALENNIPFVATNIPRKYAAAVGREGLEVLETFGDEASRYMAPMPIKVDKALPNYAAMADMMHGSGMNADKMIAAQASKDATMAHFILQGLSNHQNLLHINGAYHSNDYEGIVWYLKFYRPNIRVMTITTVEQEDIRSLNEEFFNKADFIFLFPLDSHKSF